MKIDSLEIEGFGPFRDTQSVDLARYAADGIFLITGRTGTGKSSILDAICFALYGTTPRASEGERRFRSDYAKDGQPSRVALEFTVGDDAWRIVRTPEYMRPKQRGEGLTPQRSSVELFRGDGDGWIGVATKEKEVDSRVADIVGMNGEQFQQVILLAQGRFAKFLLAKNDDRQKLLRSLFGTRRFEQYEKSVEERRKAAEATVRDEQAALNAILDEVSRGVIQVSSAPPAPGTADEQPPVPEVSLVEGEEIAFEPPSALDADIAETDIPGRLAQADHALAVAAERVEAASTALTLADSARSIAESRRDAAHKLADSQRRRDTARAALAELDAERDDIEAARAELDAARRAETTRTAIAAVTRAEATAEQARAAADAARQAWIAARDEHDGAGVPAANADPQELEAFADELKGRIGAWEPLREQETGLVRDAERIDERRTELEALDERIHTLAAREQALPERIRSAQKQRDDAAARAARAEQVEAHILALEAQFRAVHEVDERTTEYAAAEAAVTTARAARDAAEAALDELHRRRLAGYSSELAQQLTPGVACAVCGSTEHPAPATPGDDHVTPEAIDEADAARAAAVEAYETATAARQRVELALRDAETRAGGRTATEVDGDLLTARQSKADAENALAQKTQLEKEIEKLEAERDTTASDHAARREERAQLATEIAAAEKSLVQARSEIEAAREGYASIAERIGAARRISSHATSCAATETEHARAVEATTSARDALAEALAAARFESADTAVAAQRSASSIAALEQRVTSADTRRATAQATLDELAEVQIPDEAIELAGVDAALEQAREARDAAAEHRTQAVALVAALEASVARARAAYDRLGERAEKVATITRLADTIAGREPNTRRMNLETFVLAAELEEIVDAANTRLAEMSDNRYTLRHSDQLARRKGASGLGIEVFDAYSGQARAPHTLSGGETFLASLSLALGLAEVVTNRAGGIRLDTLFIDEGFGSLDAETLETAMRTLDDLRQGGRTVGLISHVDAMKEQIPAQLRVRRAPGGWSTVEQ